VQATIANPDHILKPGMFATHHCGAAGQSRPVVTVPETAVDYTLYGDFRVFSLPRRKRTTARPALTAVRTFVQARQPDRRPR